MAACAVGPELTVVNIVRFVAIGAAASKPHLHVQRLPVAGLALDALMRALESESRLHVVIEDRLLPPDRVVTNGTSVAEAAAVGVVVAMAFDALLRCIAKDVRLMAILALALLVLAEQGEAGQPVIEEDVVLPRRLVVAVLAGRAERTVVCIVVLVAGQAVGSQHHLEYRLDVAGRALGVRVSSVQSMAGVDGMIKAHLGPSGTHVAGLALLAEMPVVVVVFLMTTDAAYGELVREGVVAMTGIALLLCMLAIEHEARIPVVIEARIVPTGRVVTVAAFYAAAPVVCIVLGMTAKACRGRIGKGAVSMAVATGRLLVLADQRVAGRIVIEFDLEPVAGRMAIAALCAQFSRMRIVVLMTREAVARRIAMPLLGLMTILALIVRMFAEQREVRQVVAE